MSDAPERIWAHGVEAGEGRVFLDTRTSQTPGYSVEYVRADAILSDPRVMALVEAATGISLAQKVARNALGPMADRGHIEAVALRYVRLEGLDALAAALAALQVKP